MNDHRISGTLQRKSGRYYAVVYYYDDKEKRRSKTFATGITIESQNKRVCTQNERAAKRKLEELIRSFVPPQNNKSSRLFVDDIKKWLTKQQPLVAPATFSGYCYAANDVLEYFSAYANLCTEKITASIIEDYMNWERNRRNPNAEMPNKKRIKNPDGSGIENTIMRRFAVIRMVLQIAKRDGRITSNPAAKRDSWISLPKPQRSSFTILSIEEANKLLNVVQDKDLWLNLAVHLALVYGLRRSEVLGLRMTDIDYVHRRMTCQNTVTQQTINNKNVIVSKPCTKNRTLKVLGLTDETLQKFDALINANSSYKQEFGDAYNPEWDGYIFRHPDGNIIAPNYLTRKFSEFLQRNGLKKMRFHDLRHSCATLLYSQGVAPKTIQQVLGHSQLSTTTEIYTHLFGGEKDSAVHNLANALTKGIDGKIDGTNEQP